MHGYVSIVSYKKHSACVDYTRKKAAEEEGEEVPGENKHFLLFRFSFYRINASIFKQNVILVLWKGICDGN